MSTKVFRELLKVESVDYIGIRNAIGVNDLALDVRKRGDFMG